jgi:hypothetical protein
MYHVIFPKSILVNSKQAILQEETKESRGQDFCIKNQETRRNLRLQKEMEKDNFFQPIVMNQFQQIRRSQLIGVGFVDLFLVFLFGP